MGNDNSILIVILVAVAYLFFIQPSAGAKPEAGERYCPKGERYPATQWELLFGCREGYDRKLFGDDCVCTAPTPATTPEGTPSQSPQTPVPKPSPQPAPDEYIPPGFIGSCKLWKDNTYWVLSNCDADDYNCTTYRLAKAADYGMRACKS